MKSNNVSDPISIRSKIMASVGHKNTGPEMILRRSLHRIGLRYRLHDKRLPGSPDIIFPKYKAVLFVNGCFWHRHGCKKSTTPKTNFEFWQKKFSENIDRDQRNIESLLNGGWRVGIVWECILVGKRSDPDSVASVILKWLHSNETFRSFSDY